MKLQDLFFLAVLTLAYIQLVKGQAFPGCQSSCGNISIEYPFGISSGCYYAQDRNFNLSCDNQKLTWRGLDVINTSHSGHLRVQFPIAYICYDSQGKLKSRNTYNFKLLTLSLSDNNSFTGVGCNTGVLLTNFEKQNHTSGCISVCAEIPEKGSCSGEGCCQTSIPQGNNFNIRLTSFDNQSFVHAFNPCSYAFIAENGVFDFKAKEDLLNLRNVKQFPALLDWSIGNQTCEEVGSGRICSTNSTCDDSSRGIGYICQCNEGYNGNPYLKHGCKDIDECSIRKHNCGDIKYCKNSNGSFTCDCPSNFRHDFVKGCTRKAFGWTIILLGTTIGFLVLLLGVIFTQQKIRHRKGIQLRQHFFEQNGGGMLKQRLSGAGSSNVDIRIFTEEGMKTATNGYEDSRILGEGGQGTVYKGLLPDNSIVAIKKARLGDRSQVEQFINEVLVLSQINHRNVVKLLGCCLETEVPLLIYEFVSNGTLYEHLHDSMGDSSLTWEDRLRIAIEVAGTLAYLHSSASIPIIHRDIKTANILLDEHLTAKVADFGASKLIPMDKEQLTTMVQGTLGYLDPEYYNTGLLNEKSDVYSFGVVLMELLSGHKALSFERPLQSKNLVSYFVSATRESRLGEIIEGYVMNLENQREIYEAAKVAVKCTRVMGEERPKMKEVAVELESLRGIKSKHHKSDQYFEPERIEQLLDGQILSAQGDTSSFTYDSIKNAALADIETGR